MAKLGKGKQRLPIPENLAYCKIIFSINNNNYRAQEIANELEIDQSVVIRHLKTLIKEGYVKLNLIKKTKYYSLENKRIIIDFFEYIEKIEHKKIDKVAFEKNGYVNKLFNEFLLKYHKRKIYITLNELFGYIINSNLDQLIVDTINTKETKEFLQFLKKYTNYPLGKEFQEILFEVEDKINKMLGYDKEETLKKLN